MVIVYIINFKSFYLKRRICPTNKFYCISSATLSAANEADSIVGHMIVSTVFFFHPLPIFLPITLNLLLLLWFNVMHPTLRNMLDISQD